MVPGIYIIRVSEELLENEIKKNIYSREISAKNIKRKFTEHIKTYSISLYSNKCKLKY